MAVTEYKPKYDLGCRYSYDKLENVVYLVSKEHVKNVHIDGGEAYIDNLTEVPLRLEGFNIQFSEESSLDERYKFTKQVSISVHGYTTHKSFLDRYYVILKSKDGTKWMVNVDFPSKVTYTFNLNGSQYQTDFTFSSVSNFPTLRLATDIDEGISPCKQLRTFGIKKLKMLENNYCTLDTDEATVYTYGHDFVDVEFLGQTCSLQETFDGEKVTTQIDFNIAFDAYKSSWHYNLLEFLQNHYSAIILPKGSDEAFFCGFSFGLEPSFKISTNAQNGTSDIITVTLIESSLEGSIKADEWYEEEDTDVQWVYIKNVGEIEAYECIGFGLAKYLLKQEVTKNGFPTNRYMALDGYAEYFEGLGINIVDVFYEEETFSNPSCSGTTCQVITNIPSLITYNAVTCNTYNYSASCDWNVDTTLLSNKISVYPLSGYAGSSYTVSVCCIIAPTNNDSSSFSITSGDNKKIVNVNLTTESDILSPSSVTINCLSQNVSFNFNPNCRITVTSIDSRLTYNITNSQLIVNVPRNYSVESGITWSIGVKDCNNKTQTVTIIQDKTYETWVDTSGYICSGTTSYVKQQRYTGTTSSSINVPTSEYRAGAVIEVEDSRCGGGDTRWVTSSAYTCVDGDKWSIEEEEKKVEGGTWQKTGNSRLKEMVESASTFCSQNVQYKWELTDKWECYGGDIPFQGKWLATYVDLSTTSADCDASSAITNGEITLTGLISVEIGDCVSTIGEEAFSGYTALTSVVIPNSVLSIADGAFYVCTSLRSINIPNSVTSIGNKAFGYCYSIEDIDIPDSVTSIGSGMCRYCISLTSVTIGSYVTSIGGSAFQNCDSLISITCLATTPPNCVQGAFDNTNNCQFYVPSASVDAYKAASGWSDYASRIQAIP